MAPNLSHDGLRIAAPPCASGEPKVGAARSEVVNWPRARNRTPTLETAIESRATATWEGDLMNGHGTTSAASGVLKGANLSWKARIEGAAAHTTPEELLAASHASCFSMALSHALAQAGKPAEQLETRCLVTFGPKSAGGVDAQTARRTVKR